MSSVVATSSSPGLLLLVWLHGFKGGDDTFESFPERLTFLLSETWPQTKCTSIIYPAYDTRGSLVSSPETSKFRDTTRLMMFQSMTFYRVEASTSQSKNNGREQAYIVLLGHSMGGLVIADAALKLIRERDAGTALQETIIWPGIIGLVGYDTPYYGLNPTLFTNTANEYLAHVKTAQQVMNNFGFGLGLGSMQGAASSSSSSRAGPSGGSKTTPEKPAEKKTTTTTPPTNAANNNWMKLGLAAIGVASLAAGTTYWQKDKITENVGWATSHLDYVKELFETDRLNQRMTDIMQIHPVVNFHCFYTEIPKLDAKTTDRHFISLPNSKTLPTGIDALFTANRNQKASNEIVAHTSMFNQNMNSGYWDLGKDSGRLITEWLQGSYQRRWKLKQSMADAGLGDKPSCTRSTQDPTIRDQLSREAQVNLDAQVGDQVQPLHNEL